MKLFADTANHKEIEECFEKGVNDGITTNPKIMESAGVSNFEEACRGILAKYPDVPVSLETDLRGIKIGEIEQRADDVARVLLNQAYLLANMAKNVVVKIPICKGGLIATRELYRKGIKTNVTACMTPYQALEAARAGATYVSLFANRMLDSHILELSGHKLDEILTNNAWKDIVKSNKVKYFHQAWDLTLQGIAYVASSLQDGSQLIVGSIREPADVYLLARAEPQIITIPHKIMQGLDGVHYLKNNKRIIFGNGAEVGNSLHHPMTQFTLEEFERAADSYRKGN